MLLTGGIPIRFCVPEGGPLANPGLGLLGSIAGGPEGLAPFIEDGTVLGGGCPFGVIPAVPNAGGPWDALIGAIEAVFMFIALCCPADMGGPGIGGCDIFP